jgi:3-hydroxymyristoyl/3-hydroxydecanoyl-(acyl carrier protein) dehydratase
MAPGTVEAPLVVPRDHPAFAGHFPGRPIRPAVVLLAEALAAIEKATSRAAHQWTVSQAKFPSAVTPGTALTLMHEASASGAVRFEIRSAAGVVAHGVLAPRAPA